MGDRTLSRWQITLRLGTVVCETVSSATTRVAREGVLRISTGSLAIGAMVLVSLVTADRIPAHTHRLLVRLHSPEPDAAVPSGR